MGSPTSERLLAYLHDAEWRAFPEAVRTEAVRTLVNWVGCALGGCRSGIVERALTGTASGTGAPVAGLIGRGERLDPCSAALINCLASAVHAYDDTHLETVTHPTGPVAAALLAMAESRPLSGEALLTGLVLGMELECRLSSVILAAGGSTGWYITGVTGGIGSAAAIGRAMNLDHGTTGSALGLAATQACGFRGTHGSMASPLVPALAARNGLWAALLAAEGFTCGFAALDGPNGLLSVLSPEADFDDVVAGLGDRFAMLDNAYKPYPCGIVIHPTIDACLAIRAAGLAKPEAITGIELQVDPLAFKLGARAEPRDEFEAQVSLAHWAAVSLLTGAAGLPQATAAAVADPGVRALRSRVRLTADPALARDQARAHVHLEDGSVLHAETEHATGSRDRPMTDAELDRKFRDQADPILGRQRAADLLEQCRGAASADNVATLLAAAATA